MTQSQVLQIALPTPLRRLFDYLPPKDLDLTTKLIPGTRVRVPFQSRSLVGILISIEKTSHVPYEKLKHAEALLDEAPILSDDVYTLCQWAAEYYHYALGEVLSAALPAWLRKGKPALVKDKKEKMCEQTSATLTLNDNQAQALDAIIAKKNSFNVFLLDGITGSGKTEVYLQTIRHILDNAQQVLVLVPEISLTPQTIARFRARFDVPIVTLHSGLSEQARLQAWLAAKSGKAKIVIGTRSAIFTPFQRLGLIIVDEEHDTSFKQQDRFRYHARDLAIKRASINHIPIVLGSATPSLETLLNVKRNRYHYLSLPLRAGGAHVPQFEILDTRRITLEEGLSPTLLKMMQTHLDEGNQVLLFLNRRGFAPVLYCADCAEIINCKRCDARMVYHRKPPKLKCHYCDTEGFIPKRCAACNSENVQPVGLGTQRLEQKLEYHFSGIPIIRVDRDTTSKKNSMQALLDEINTHQKSILIGTQMLAKGHHFPNVTLVGVVDADSGLFSVDFRAAEQMGQLLLQVSGRAGREEKKGTVLIQTRHPEHPLLHTLVREGYAAFSDKLLIEREQALLPPFSYFAIFRAEAYIELNANQFLTMIKEVCAEFNDAVQVLGPVPSIMAKRKGLYCQQLLLQATTRSILQKFLKNILERIDEIAKKYPVKWILDVDPMEI